MEAALQANHQAVLEEANLVYEKAFTLFADCHKRYDGTTDEDIEALGIISIVSILIV